MSLILCPLHQNYICSCAGRADAEEAFQKAKKEVSNMFLNCKECKNCEEREKNLSDKMNNLLADLNNSFKDGERTALIRFKNIFNAIINAYLEKVNDSRKHNEHE